MSSEVMVRPDVRVAPLSRSFDEMLRVAETLLKSGFLPYSIKTPAQAVAIILMGREVGLPEMQALRSINVIQGKPTLSAELMLALFSSRVNGKSKIVTSTDTECTIVFERPGREPHTQTFTLEQAKRLGFATKDNYAKQPATMLQWRCVSAGLRFYAPDAIAGISYTPDELGAEVNPDTGEVINTTLARGEVPVEDDVPTVDLRADVTINPAQTVPLIELRDSEGRSRAAIPTPTPPPTPVQIALPVASEAPKTGTQKPPKPDYQFFRELDRLTERLGKSLQPGDAEAVYRKILKANGFDHRDQILDRPAKVKVFNELKEVTEAAEGLQP